MEQEFEQHHSMNSSPTHPTRPAYSPTSCQNKQKYWDFFQKGASTSNLTSKLSLVPPKQLTLSLVEITPLRIRYDTYFGDEF